MDSSPFPVQFINEIRKLPGNDCCCGCFSMDTDWACVLFGTLICLDCAGRHRSLGVKVSFVRSIYLDAWSQKQIEILRHGGNGRFKLYMKQCQAGFKDSNYGIEEYVRICQSAEAEAYKAKLLHHVEGVMSQAAHDSDENRDIGSQDGDEDDDSIFTARIVEVYDDDFEEELDSFGNIIMTSPNNTSTSRHGTPQRTSSGQNTPLRGLAGFGSGSRSTRPISAGPGLPVVPSPTAPETNTLVMSPPGNFPMTTLQDSESHTYIADWITCVSRCSRFSTEFSAGPMGMSIAADKGTHTNFEDTGAESSASVGVAITGASDIFSYACVTKVKPGGAAEDRGVCVGDVVVDIGGRNKGGEGEGDSEGAELTDRSPVSYREITRLVSTHPRPVTIHFAREVVNMMADESSGGSFKETGSPQSPPSPHTNVTIHTQGSNDSATPFKRRHSFAKVSASGSTTKTSPRHKGRERVHGQWQVSGEEEELEVTDQNYKVKDKDLIESDRPTGQDSIGSGSSGSSSSGSNSASNESALEALEDVLLTDQEKTYSRGAAVTIDAVNAISTDVVHNATVIPITPPADVVETGADTASNVGIAAVGAATSVRCRDRVPFAASTDDASEGGEVEEDTVLEAQRSTVGHDLSILMEQITNKTSADVTVTRSTLPPPVPVSTIPGWSQRPALPSSTSTSTSIQIRQQSANSWEYEVLFLTKPYGFTLSKSSAPESQPNLNTTPYPAVVTKVQERGKAAQQGVYEGDIVVAVNRVTTPTYEDVLQQIDEVHKRCAVMNSIEDAASISSCGSSGSSTSAIVPAQVPVIFLLRRSLSYIVASTSSILATESKKLLTDTINLSRSLLGAISPSTSTSSSPGVSRTSTPGVCGNLSGTSGVRGAAGGSSSMTGIGHRLGVAGSAGTGMPFQQYTGGRQSSLGSGTASIVINTKSISSPPKASATSHMAPTTPTTK